MESISIANKILQDPKRSCKILQDPTRSYKILRDTRQKCFRIHINSKQDPTRFSGILDKNAMESISIANKILQDSTGYQTKMLWNPYQQQTRSYKILKDPARSYKILQEPTRFYGILDKNALESKSIANKNLQDSTGYQTKMLWNPYQQQTRSYKILRDTRQKCYGIHINSKQDPTRS